MSNDPFLAVARLLAKASRYRPFGAWLRRLAAAYAEAQSSARAQAGEVPEILALDARPAAQQAGARLNLLVPALSSRHLFGGVETALQVFDALRPRFDRARIVVTDEVEPQPRPGAYYSGWPIRDLEAGDTGEDHVVAAGSRYGRTLQLGQHDFLMATAWWTAHNGFALLEWQRRQYPDLGERRLLYLIQDYEPGFYPWGARHVLARATYGHPESTVAAVNSQPLADYLREQGHRFPALEVLQPQFNAGLKAVRDRHDSFRKDRVLLVYGRPGTERNAFALVVAALRRWVHEYQGAPKWRIVSAGEAFAPIELGRGCALESLGKLDIDEYARLLSQSACGLSLMISPHPSYTPLEMAAFGVRVVTNRFGPKDLSGMSSFITSVDLADPASLAASLVKVTGECDASCDVPRAVRRADIDWNGDFLDRPGLSTRWADQVRDILSGAVVSPWRSHE